MPQPTSSELFELARQRFQAGQLDEARALCQQIVSEHAATSEAWHMLAVIARRAGQVSDAITSLDKAIDLSPGNIDLLESLGGWLKESGRLQESASAYRQAAALRPDLPEMHFKLGNVLTALGLYRPAMNAYDAAMALHPADEASTLTLGNTLVELRRPVEAASAFGRVLRTNSASFEACFGLGNAFREMGLMDEAIGAYERALQIRPTDHQALNNLANQFKETGRINEAIATYGRAAKHSRDPRIGGNLLYSMHFHAGYDAPRLAEAHAKWNREYAEPLSRERQLHDNERSPDRRLRIGYVSPDFRDHPVGRFLLPLLAHHRRQAVEIFCYADNTRPDAMTARFRALADHFCESQGLADAELAQRIREERIDILVDLAMHTAGNRLLTFARRPAPVQLSYLAYCSTTGLKAIDYRISDPYIHPPGMNERWYSEKTVRLPRTYWCYDAPAEAPPVGAPPSIANGFVTFGCLNNFAKSSPEARSAWIDLLRSMPGARLILHAHEGSHRQHLREQFKARDVDPARLEFVGFFKPADYYSQYHRIDVALDPFPYGGGSTTFDALWMGLPVVSLPGRTGVGRGGASIVMNLGKPQWLAASLADYKSIAKSLAENVECRIALRHNMRHMMQSSPLMDHARFADDFESLLRQLWQRFCSPPGHE